MMTAGVVSRPICKIQVNPVGKRVPPRCERLSAAEQRLLDELLVKDREGTISTAEKIRLNQLVAHAERLMLATAKSRPPGSAIGKLRIVEQDESHLDDFGEYMP